MQSHKPMKSFLKSKTVQSAIGAFLLLVGSTGLDIYKQREVHPEHIAAILGGAITLKGVVDGRATAEGLIYTPPGFKGPRKKELDINEKLEEMVAAAIAPRAASAAVLPPDFDYIDSLPSESEIDSPELPESRSNGEFTREDLPQNRNSNYVIQIVHDTVIKTSLKDSSLLEKEEFLEVGVGEQFDVDAYDKSEFNHLKAKFLKDGIWYYFFIPHVALYDNKGNQINLEDRTDEAIIAPVKKTPINLPGYGTGYLEDPIYPGSNFYWSEFSKNGSRPPETKEQVDNAICVAELLDKIRDHFGAKPIIITSWFRPYAVNKAVGGAANSQHLNGGAADFYINGVSEQEVYDYIDPWHGGGLAIKHGSFCHIDCRNYRARWNY